MSRIGRSPIQIPTTVVVEIEGQKISASGPLGSLFIRVEPQLKVEKVNNKIVVRRNGDDKSLRSLHGLTRTLLYNMVLGVEKGWQKKLELVGVGFRAQAAGDKLTLAIGYSHPIEISAPESINFKVEDNTKITVSGINKALVGQVAANIRKVRPPEPYQGKGIRYSGEYVRKKAGKAGKVGITK